ncbi:hypothetical protein JW796_03315 [Candidatus Dojkabacteria bacterium]|nr:hypothetical protein [Candidatus Dojkabacteria bacterium]
MNKKVLIFLVTLVLSFTLSGCAKNSSSDSIADHTSKNGSVIFIYGARVFTSPLKDSDLINANISITTNMIFDLSKQVKGFTISEISITSPELIGIVKKFKPKHILRSDNCVNWYLGACDEIPDPAEIASEGDSFDFLVVEHEAAYLDEISKEGYFNVIYNVVVTEIAQVSSRKIEADTGHFENSKVLQYAGLNEKQLSFDLTYQVKIEFEDGEEFSNQYRYIVNALDLIEKGYTTENTEDKL